jgi:hypothetical protein
VRVAFVPRSAEIKPLFWRFVQTNLHKKKIQYFLPQSNNTFICVVSVWFKVLFFSTPPPPLSGCGRWGGNKHNHSCLFSSPSPQRALGGG